MKLDQYLTRPAGAKSLLLIIATVLMALSYFAFAAPPRPAARRAPAARPAPAHRPARHHPAAHPPKKVPPRRIGTLRPVVVGSTGTIVVRDNNDDVQVIAVPEETPSQTTAAEETPASTGETMHTAAPADASGVPSDADASMADSPRYKVVSVEDNGLTIVVNVDGQETPIRMIGLAEPENKKTDDRPSPGPGAHRDSMGMRGGPGRVPPTDIFLQNLLKGEEVYVVYDSMVQEQDEDGNYVAYVYRAPDGLLLNSEVLRQGLGVVDPGYDFSEKETFLYYQNQAQQAQKGLWNKNPQRGMRNGKPGPGPLGKPEGMRK